MIELFFKYMGIMIGSDYIWKPYFISRFTKNIMEVILHVPRQVSHLVRLA